MPDFDALAKDVKLLDQLLEDQQPGLLSWCMMVGATWKRIADRWQIPGSAVSAPETPVRRETNET